MTKVYSSFFNASAFSYVIYMRHASNVKDNIMTQKVQEEVDKMMPRIIEIINPEHKKIKNLFDFGIDWLNLLRMIFTRNQPKDVYAMDKLYDALNEENSGDESDIPN